MGRFEYKGDNVYYVEPELRVKLNMNIAFREVEKPSLEWMDTYIGEHLLIDARDGGIKVDSHGLMSRQLTMLRKRRDDANTEELHKVEEHVRIMTEVDKDFKYTTDYYRSMRRIEKLKEELRLSKGR